jgi:hypothetical protein
LSAICELLDTHQSDRVRCRLNNVTRRWTYLEHELVDRQEKHNERARLMQDYRDQHVHCQQCLEQADRLLEQHRIDDDVSTLHSSILQGKSLLTSLSICIERLTQLTRDLQQSIHVDETVIELVRHVII